MEYYIWLQLCFQWASKKTDYILENFNVKEFYERAKKGEEFNFLNENDIEKLRKTDLDKAIYYKTKTLVDGFSIIPHGSRFYPRAFEKIADKPIVLYAEGNLGLLNDSFCMTVIGSRKISEYALISTADVSFNLARCGATIVSGFALGGDTAAHYGAVMADGTSIAVLGCGLDINYPKQNFKLSRDLLDRGLRISEHLVGTTPINFNFPKRNRILSALSKGIVIAEAGEKSGALITVNMAQEHGKDVFIVPNNIYNNKAQGAAQLLKEGGILASTAADILKEYENDDDFTYIDADILNENEKVNIDYLREMLFENDFSTYEKSFYQNQMDDFEGVYTKTKKENTDIGSYDISKNAKDIYWMLKTTPLDAVEISQILKVDLGESMVAITELEMERLITVDEEKKYCIAT